MSMVDGLQAGKQACMRCHCGAPVMVAHAVGIRSIGGQEFIGLMGFAQAPSVSVETKTLLD
ncbi:hypothetical protein ACFFJ4_05315 [Xanthomonas dyei]|uniref:hypothetical protein n=1 Tax=Xanthomonas dyei TaxID=743699 RepID=UPI0011B09F94|nr:hypothetical protein [Xanthomonas dyei]